MYSIKQSELHQLAMLLARCSMSEKTYEKEMKRFQVAMEPESRAFTEAFRIALPRVCQNDLALLSIRYGLAYMLLNTGVKMPEMRVLAYIERLEAQDSKDFLADYLMRLFKLEATASDASIKEKLQKHKAENLETFMPSFKDFQEFRDSIDQIKGRFVELLKASSGVLGKLESDYGRLCDLAMDQAAKTFENPEYFEQHFNIFQLAGGADQVKEIHVFPDAVMEGTLAAYLDLENHIVRFSIGTHWLRTFVPEKEKEIEEEFFKNLSDPTKVRILELIAKEQLCAQDLVKRLGLSKGTISYHLSKLLVSQMVRISVQEGKRNYFEVNHLEIERTWARFYARLK